MASQTPDGPIQACLREEHRRSQALIEGLDFNGGRSAVAAFEEFARRLERRIAWEEGALFPAVARSLSAIVKSPTVSCRGCCASQRPGLGLRASAALDPSEMLCPACGIATLAGAGEDHSRLRGAVSEVLQALRGGDAETAARRGRSLREFLAVHHTIEERVLYPACDLVLPAEQARALAESFAR